MSTTEKAHITEKKSNVNNTQNAPDEEEEEEEVNDTNNIKNTEENKKDEDEEYEVEVTEPPEYQLKELENVDDSKIHPTMRRDQPTTDIDMDHLVPETDKQRRRESIVLDEDGEEFKQIQADREERIKIMEKREQSDEQINSEDAIATDLENDAVNGNTRNRGT
eukprot:78555_1